MSRKKIEYDAPTASASPEELRAMVEVLRAERYRLLRTLVSVTHEKYQLIDRQTQFRRWMRLVHSSEQELHERIARLEAEVERLGGAEPSSTCLTSREWAEAAWAD